MRLAENALDNVMSNFFDQLNPSIATPVEEL